METRNTDNTHRTLKRLVIVDAWFCRLPNSDNRYTLHADVTFNEERLGGESEAAVIFKVSVKRCEIAFVKPKGDFTIDRKTVRRLPPLHPEEVKRQNTSKTSARGAVKLSMKPIPSAELHGDVEHSRTKEETTSSTYTRSPFNEQLTRSINGDDAWRVDGSAHPTGRLEGPVFDAHSEPRLTLIDLRSNAHRQRDEKNSMTPVSHIEVHCLREDIDIYDIQFKDEARQGWFRLQPAQKEKLAVAQGVLREALLQEGLSAGSVLNDPYAEMTICDATIPLVDQSDKSG